MKEIPDSIDKNTDIILNQLYKEHEDKSLYERMQEEAQNPFRVVDGIVSRKIAQYPYSPETLPIYEKSIDVIIDPVLNADSKLIHAAVQNATLIFNYQKPINFYTSSDNTPFVISSLRIPFITINDLYNSIFSIIDNEHLSKDKLRRLFPNAHCPILVTNEKIRPQVGITAPSESSIISFDWFSHSPDFIREEVKKTAIYHELGHLFELIQSRRGEDKIEQFLGGHCKTDGCSMKQGNTPSDWITTTKIGLKRNMIFCEECLQDINEIIPSNTNQIIMRSINNKRV